MSNPNPPVPVVVVADERPTRVVVVTHSPLFYWWPVWVVGFLMAWLSFWAGDQVAFVPPGTVAKLGAQVEGVAGARDVLIAPDGRRLTAAADSDELTQPRLRMLRTNDAGIVWAATLLLVVFVTHVELRGMWSVVVVMLIAFITVVFAVLGLWDSILRAVRVVDIHINAFGYLTISLLLFLLWLVMFLVYDPLKYMVFTRGRLRVRKVIGEGEKVFDMRGMVLKRHRDDMFRHWLLGFGTADLTVMTAGANAQQIEMPNVFGIARKLELINKMLQETEVAVGR
jgi:hypothetical protein